MSAPAPAPEPQVITMGCRLNTFESEVIRDHATQAGLHDAIILNTCAVTAEAERQARQTIRQMRKRNPNKRIIVTGCAAQLDPAKFAAMPEVDDVIGNDEKMKAETFAALHGDAQVQVADIMMVRDTAAHLVRGFDGREYREEIASAMYHSPAAGCSCTAHPQGTGSRGTHLGRWSGGL